MTKHPVLPSPSPRHQQTFAKDLLAWYDREARDMPWRRSRDPYRIWISEIMLQQTRVDQAWPYYERFVAAFPTVEALAGAALDDVLRLWEGLGYYSRARNLHKAARRIVEEHAGKVPDSYESFIALPGVGPYTAAAVLSIAFDRPHAVLDGNVARVLTRVFCIELDVKAPATRRQLQNLADHLLNKERPGDSNQAVMELGATICTPVAPKCPACPIRPVCGAYAAGEQDRYPVSQPRPPVPHYDIAIGIVSNDEGKLLIQQRPAEGLLGGLWEFPGGKQEPGESIEEACRRELREELSIEVRDLEPFARISHAYTHFKVTLHAFQCRINSGEPQAPEGIPVRWVAIDDLAHYAFPRANRRLIERLLDTRQTPSLFD